MSTPAAASILALMTGPLSSVFGGESWAAWRAVLRATFALPMDWAGVRTFRRLTGRRRVPKAPARELWLVCGRRAGKSIVAALVAVWAACCRTYALAPGEVGVFMVIARDRRQARIIRRYIGGLLAAHPALAALVAHETAERIELASGIAIEIHTASFRAIRGYTVIGAVLDEIAYWPTDDGADPDHEILAALRPATATVAGAILVALSTPYARRGELWRTHREHFGQSGDDVLVVQAATRELNPTVPQAVIDRAYADDPATAAAEYGAEFRRDIESFIGPDVLDAVRVTGRHELPPVPGVPYVAFTDPAGGSGADAMTLAVAHAETRDGQTIAVLDAVREVRPRFSPEQVVGDFAALLARYHVTTVVGDRYAGQWPAEQFRRHGIEYRPSERVKSDIYRDALPLLMSGQVELLDHPRVLSQFAGLERRTARGGRDSIDHAPGSHDDGANAVGGALVLTAGEAARPKLDLLFSGGGACDDLLDRLAAEGAAIARGEIREGDAL